MSHWYGYRAIGLDGSNPGLEILEGPFSSYQDAKKVRNSLGVTGYERTRIFTAESRTEAETQMRRETFSKL